MGVQSFIEAEAHGAGRAQKTAEVEAALDRIRAAGFPTLNLDLIYGLPGQTVATWLASIEAALRYAPEELYLYPLYVRPLTGLDRTSRNGKAWDDVRLACYREGRARLLDAGYTQVSMRMFQVKHAPAQSGPAYCCQEDGMVGLGCGARSYTRRLHYSSDYAVGAKSVRAILADYVSKPPEAFSVAEVGYTLDEEDQRRRFAIQSLLHGDGLDLCAYRHRFGSEALDDLPELAELPAHGLAEYRGPVLSSQFSVLSPEGPALRLTERGVERSDTIGPWLYSARAQRLSAEYDLR
jgi:oxygen-independent coproporphyrinogen-3 oxidase